MEGEYKKIILLKGLEPINDYQFSIVKSLLARDLGLTANMQKEYNKVKIADLMEKKFPGIACVNKLIDLFKEMQDCEDIVINLRNGKRKVMRQSRGKETIPMKKIKPGASSTEESTSTADGASGSVHDTPESKKQKSKTTPKGGKKVQPTQQQSQLPEPSATSTQSSGSSLQGPQQPPATPYSSGSTKVRSPAPYPNLSATCRRRHPDARGLLSHSVLRMSSLYNKNDPLVHQRETLRLLCFTNPLRHPDLERLLRRPVYRCLTIGSVARSNGRGADELKDTFKRMSISLEPAQPPRPPRSSGRAAQPCVPSSHPPAAAPASLASVKLLCSEPHQVYWQHLCSKPHQAYCQHLCSEPHQVYWQHLCSEPHQVYCLHLCSEPHQVYWQHLCSEPHQVYWQHLCSEPHQVYCLHLCSEPHQVYWQHLCSEPHQKPRLKAIPREAAREEGVQKGPKKVMVLKATEPFVYDTVEPGKKMFHATVATESQFFQVKVFQVNLKEKFVSKNIITISDYVGRNGFLEVYDASSVSEVSADQKMEVSSGLIQKANATPKISDLYLRKPGTFVNGIYEVHKKNVLNEQIISYEIQDNTGKMEVWVYGRLTKVDCEEGDKLRLTCFELSDNVKKLRSVIHSFMKVIKSKKNKKQPLDPDSHMETSP
ncbi:interferon-activable protein 203-like [Lycaon pictus]